MIGLLLLATGIFPTAAATVVRFGEVRSFSSPSHLDLEGDLVYAINFSPDDPPRTVRGVTFTPDTSPPRGATLVGPQSVVGWQNRPVLGSGVDATQLAEVMHDIRWASADSGERLRASLAVNAGDEYKLQILISANGPENRRWDLRINGREAVDELSSLGIQPGGSYSPDRCVVYTCTFVAPSAVAVIEMGNLFGIQDGGDRNPIWQALTLERLTQPTAPSELRLVAPRLFANHRGPVAGLQVVDGKSSATHTLSFVAGEGDRDNARFALAETNLLAGDFDFSTVAVGTAFRIRLRATDTTAPERSLERSFVLTLLAAHPPSRLDRDATTLSTHAKPGSPIAILRTDDPDTFDTPAYALVSGDGSTHNALVELRGGTVILVTAPPSPTEALSLRVRATDQAGLFVESPLVFPRRAPRVRLNELVASRTGGVTNEFSAPTEWLELANDTAQYEPLDGWHLTDSRGTPGKWPFPPVTLAPHEFRVVLMDGLGQAPAGSPLLHAGFSLSSDGEWIGLTPPSSAVTGDELEYPPLFPGVAYGTGAGGVRGILAVPTPRAPNGEISAHGENAVAFSRTRGFATDAFLLELTASVPGSTIRYTLDGALPTSTAGTVYTEPIRITPSASSTTRGVRTVRALALHPGAAFARVATHSYLFVHGTPETPASAITNQSRLGASIVRHATYGPLLDDAILALPALAVTLPQGLGTAERRASIELLDPSLAEAGFQAECGIAATGTTSLGSPKLSMAARFRAEYGQSRLRYPVFARGSMAGEGAATEFKELRLRSHSHDTFYWLGMRENPPTPYGSPPVTRGGDAQLGRNLWIEETQLLMGQPGKRGRQVHLFLNGSYHGLYHVQEHADHDFMASYYPGDDTDFHFTGAALSGSEHASGDTWRTTWSRVKASLSSEAEARRWIDVTNLCDYMVLSFYAGNDWDWSAQHNWSAAGPREPGRGGWKFFQQDSDIALQDVNANCTDQDVPDGLFTALMRYPDFRVLFRDRVQRHLFGDGVLTPARAGALYDVRMLEIQTAIIAETARWQPTSSVGALPWDRDEEWANEWRYLRETFFPQRGAKLIQQLRQRSGWWPADAPVITPAAGTLPQGTSVKLAAATSSGTVYYTLDGSDPRLPGGAVAPTAQPYGQASPLRTLVAAGAAWRFLDTGVAPSATWTRRDFDDSAWRSGPAQIGYGDGDEATVAGFVDADPTTAGVQKNLTTWFRHRFTVADPSQLSGFMLRLLCDDGAVVSLNGTEVSRVNLLTGPITPETRAIASVGGADESAFTEFLLVDAGSLLAAGENVLAVEVHQNGPDSSDISFDLELTAQARTGTPDPDLQLAGPTRVRARTRVGNDWSALAEAYLVPEATRAPSAANVALSEIHYHPVDHDDAEFLEFLNPTARGVDLSGCSISNAVRFRFPAGTALPPGERLVVVRDPAAFDSVYPASAAPIRRLGPWEGALSNSGESIRVHARDGTLLYECTFRTRAPWPAAADGAGPSLEWSGMLPLPEEVASASALLNNGISWRASVLRNGTPGRAPSTVASGTYDAWAAVRFPPGTSDALRAHAADFDGDGTSNLTEYVFALSPTEPDEPRVEVSREASGLSFLVGYRERVAPVEYGYQLEASTDLARWETPAAPPTVVSRELDGTEGVRVRVRVPATADNQAGAGTGRLFLRVRATAKP